MSNAIRSQGTKIQRGAVSAVTPKVISSITAVAALATLTTATAHGLVTGDSLTITGAVPAAYNGTYPVTVTSATTFTYNAGSAPGGAATTMGAYTGTTAAYADVEEASDIKIGGVSVDTIDVTHLQSKAKEFIAGLIDNGSLDFTCNFTNGPVQALLRADMNGGVTSPYKMVIAPNTPAQINIFFSAFVTKIDGPTAKTNGKMDIQCSAKITGEITFA